VFRTNIICSWFLGNQQLRPVQGVCGWRDCDLQIEAFLSVLDSTNSLITAFANATAYIPDPSYVDGFTSTTPCPSTDPATQIPNIIIDGVLIVGALGYDFGLFSYAGCRCNAGYDNIYTVDDTGDTTVQSGHACMHADMHHFHGQAHCLLQLTVTHSRLGLCVLKNQ